MGQGWYGLIIRIDDECYGELLGRSYSAWSVLGLSGSGWLGGCTRELRRSGAGATDTRTVTAKVRVDRGEALCRRHWGLC